MSNIQSHSQKKRFSFGKNWQDFIVNINNENIKDSELSLIKMLQKKNFDKLDFLDIGSGSGLSSLAAKNLGANVRSFDFDQNSVRSTLSLKNRFYDNDDNWTVEQGSILDNTYLSNLGNFDIVYSWGVLHHTGDMWRAFENVIGLTKKNGHLYIAIYNDQGWKSSIWWYIKYFYNKLFWPINLFYGYLIFILVILLSFTKNLLSLNLINFLKSLNYKKNKRGMKFKNDIIDWIGGFPFEFASFEKIKNYFEKNGFVLVNSFKTTDSGCHELVFIRKK